MEAQNSIDDGSTNDKDDNSENNKNNNIFTSIESFDAYLMKTLQSPQLISDMQTYRAELLEYLFQFMANHPASFCSNGTTSSSKSSDKKSEKSREGNESEGNNGGIVAHSMVDNSIASGNSNGAVNQNTIELFYMITQNLLV